MVAQKISSKEIANVLVKAKNVAIFGHIFPDGDCYGSIFALKIALEERGKNVFSYISDDIPDSLSFLKQYENFTMESGVHQVDVVFILDSSDLKRVEKSDILLKYKEQGIPLYLIDHHTKGDFMEIADFAWQDTKMSSTSEMVLNVLKEMKAQFKKDIATLLLTGIETDTSSFQNQNTTAEALEAASFLMAKGARLTQIINSTFHAKDMDTIKLFGLVLERLIYNKRYGTIVGYLTQEDVRKLGLEGDLSTGVANYLNSIEDAKMIVFITETEEGKLKVSLRTREEGVNVSELAKALGGGGHVKASGFTVNGKIENDGTHVWIA